MKPVEKGSIWVGTALTGVTGVVYLWMKYLMTPVDDFSVVNHPLEPLVLAAHILTAPLLVFALGAVTLRHVWAHYRSRTPSGRRSGLTAALVALPLVFSGYWLQVGTSPGSLSVAAWTHIVTGFVFVGAIVAHQVMRRPGTSGRPDGSGPLSEPRFRARSRYGPQPSDGTAAAGSPAGVNSSSR